PEGQLSKTFKYTVSPVAERVSGTIEASSGGATVSQTLTLRPLRPTSLAFSPSRLKGGGVSVGTVTLECSAAPGDILVTLEATAPGAASVPPSMVVPAGSKSATFSVTTKAVTSSRTVTVKATTGGVSVSASLIVDP
ncbi:MAG TPA: hypothetical protein VD968_16090, partial [Pyrinomonadaceae bacterium]|nr:hypothetical protein [Pyrinomonadaceae bacterium]